MNLRLTLLAMTMFLSSYASAGLMVQGQASALVPAGSTGVVTFTISSDAPDFFPDLFLGYEFTFHIDSSMSPGSIEFLPSGLPDPADYVFGNQSTARLSGKTFTPTMTLVPDDTLVIEDGGAPPVFLSQGSGSLVLAELHFTTNGTLPPNVGDTFRISASTSNPFIASDNTPTEITITAATGVVPEPHSLLTCLLFSTLGIIRRRR
ncbi:hypothetical protein [Rhodopirellula sp. MGV]|uniref:hypothetical protein n=1 Tax=Rhodopirellula sp. MGV TaxID=2023130 RepID=UPI000B96B247|nr:hypothetical protein [Rhodopirellula sp. MGV]OYP36018.1 hypothetical protein CGZ80_09695 [Rhodopirellula sp. MGV]PNY36624.1 hypothetical protein C2E31_12310 [Rhodopirellula baltica]